MRHSILLLLFCFLYLNCSNDPLPGSTPTIYLDPESAQETGNWESILDSTICDFIVLETTPECVIGKYSKIFFAGDTVVVCDSESMSVFLFNKNGKYLSKINKVGRSRQEYLNASDFYLKDDYIWILDQNQYKVVQYSLGGDFCNSFQYGDGYTFAVLDSQVVFNRAWGASYLDNTMLEVRDYNGKLKGLHIKTSSKDNNLYRGNNEYELIFNVSEKGCDILAPSKDIVYHYEDGEATLKYIFDFKRYALPLKMKRKGIEYLMEKKVPRENYVNYVNRVIETERYRIISFDYKKGVYYYIVDKKDESVVMYSRNWRESKQFGLFLGNLLFDGNNVIYVEQASLLRVMVENHEESEYVGKGLELYRIAKTLKGDDNGVIVRMKLKGYEI